MFRRALAIALAVVAASSCTSHPGTPASGLADLRSDGASSSDGDLVGRWALTEALAPGGDPKQLERALARLTSMNDTSMLGSTARGVVAESHGHPRA
ncbi:MAG TPA: hypothetical protein VGH87_09600, partial [Polyangiaceae bacterium]